MKLRLAVRGAALMFTVACADATAPSPSRPLAVAVGDEHACVLLGDGTARCWGRGGGGRLGDGGDSDAAAPVLVRTRVRFAALSAGGDHTCGLDRDGRAYCWGGNQAGQLGVGDSASALVPRPVIGGLRFRNLSTANATCGVTVSSALYCWGWGADGILGDGGYLDTFFVTAPIAVTPSLQFASVTVGEGPACALTSTNQPYCWGPTGQTDTIIFEPTPVGGLTTAIAVAPSVDHVCALKSDQTVTCWGDNHWDQLGNDTLMDTSSRTPVPAVDGLHFTAVASANWFTCGIVTNAAPVCWGAGALGNGLTWESARPVAVAGGLQLRAIGAGFYIGACGITIDGRVYCWSIDARDPLPHEVPIP